MTSHRLGIGQKVKLKSASYFKIEVPYSEIHKHGGKEAIITGYNRNLYKGLKTYNIDIDPNHVFRWIEEDFVTNKVDMKEYNDVVIVNRRTFIDKRLPLKFISSIIEDTIRKNIGRSGYLRITKLQFADILKRSIDDNGYIINVILNIHNNMWRITIDYVDENITTKIYKVLMGSKINQNKS